MIYAAERLAAKGGLHDTPVTKNTGEATPVNLRIGVNLDEYPKPTGDEPRVVDDAEDGSALAN
jgi:hypothetical protein